MPKQSRKKKYTGTVLRQTHRPLQRAESAHSTLGAIYTGARCLVQWDGSADRVGGRSARRPRQKRRSGRPADRALASREPCHIRQRGGGPPCRQGAWHTDGTVVPSPSERYGQKRANGRGYGKETFGETCRIETGRGEYRVETGHWECLVETGNIVSKGWRRNMANKYQRETRGACS